MDSVGRGGGGGGGGGHSFVLQKSSLKYQPSAFSCIMLKLFL